MTLKTARKLLVLLPYTDNGHQKWYTFENGNNEVFQNDDGSWDVLEMAEWAITNTPEEALVYYYNYKKKYEKNIL